MEGRGNWCEMGKRGSALQPSHVTERAAVAHPGQQQLARVDVPATAYRIQNASEVRRVGVFSHQRPGIPGRRWRDNDGAKAASVTKPAPQEVPAVAAAAMQRHYQRPFSIGGVIFRHVNGEAAAAARFVMLVNDPGVLICTLREPRLYAGILAQVGMNKETTHRR